MGKYAYIVRNSVWILLCIPGIILSFLVGTGMLIAAKKVGMKRWTVTGLIYIVLLPVLEILGLTVSDSIGAIYIAVYIIAVAHSIVILFKFIPKLLCKLNEKGEIQTAASVKTEEVADSFSDFTVSKDMYSVDKDITPNVSDGISLNGRYYDELSEKASKVNIKSSAIISNSKGNDKKININTCNEKDLNVLPGISVVAAKKAIAYRKEHNGFVSEEEFYKAAGIQLHFIKQIENKIYCGEYYNEETQVADSAETLLEENKNVHEDKNLIRKKEGRVLDI